jgi:hypothetical protein
MGKRTASVGAALARRLAAIEPWLAELHRLEDRLRAVILVISPGGAGTALRAEIAHR